MIKYAFIHKGGGYVKRLKIVRQRKARILAKNPAKPAGDSQNYGARSFSLVRELKRNADGNRKRYRADSAQRAFEKRRHKQHKGKLDKFPELKERVLEGLKNEWSPDVIAGKLQATGEKNTISRESIYHYIYNKDGRFEKWYQYLRQGQPKRHKLVGSRKKCKISIPERVSIHLRPKYIDQRKRFGD